jgi:hypothetical protein
MAGRIGEGTEGEELPGPSGSAGSDPKPDGKQRPLGIPTVKDRLAVATLGIDALDVTYLNMSQQH